MTRRQWGALLLVGLTACAGTPRGPAIHTDSAEAELAALRYELHVLTAGAVDTEPVEVDAEDFLKHMRALAPSVRPAGWSRDSARWLLEQTLQADLFVEAEGDRVVRMVPLGDDSPLATASNAQLVTRYQRLCAQHYGAGDCFGLLADGPLLDKEDRRTLALAFAFGSVLQETKLSLQHMVSPQAVLGLLVGSVMLYFMLWVVPEPLTKGVAALISLGLLAWLGAQTVWELIEG